MKRIFLDTTFIIDYLLREEYKASCVKLLTFCAIHKIGFYISFLTVTNFAYIVRKLPKGVLEEYISQIIEVFNVTPNNSLHLLGAINLHTNDFEDAIQYQTAVGCHCDCIITSNQKDYVFSAIPVISADENH